jgi:hypothetical protein
MSKGQTRGRYICKVGFYDIYAKDTMRTSKERGSKPQVASTDYDIYHAKSLKEKGFKTKDLAMAKANEMMEKHLAKV